MDENRGTQLKFVGEGRDGRFDWQYPVQFFNQFGLQIEAEGYAPEASALASIKDPEQTYEFKLKKSSDIRGQVVSSDGQPIAGAGVFLGGQRMGPSMAYNPARGYFLVSNEREHESHTDLRGNFHFKPTYRADRIVVSHDSGYAAVSLSALSNGPIALEPWSRVEGTLRIGRGPGAKQTVGMRGLDPATGKPQYPFSMNAKTDDAGRFVFEHVPEGTMEVFRVTDFHEGMSGVIGWSHVTKIQVAAAGTNEVTFGGFGRQVIGRIRTSLTNTVVDWKRDLQRLVAVRTEDPYYLAVRQDGSFLADDVPPGKYRLELRLTEPPADALSDERFMPRGRELSSLNRDVTIPEATTEQQSDEPVNLGEIVLNLKTASQVRK